MINVVLYLSCLLVKKLYYISCKREKFNTVMLFSIQIMANANRRVEIFLLMENINDNDNDKNKIMKKTLKLLKTVLEKNSLS